MGLFKHRQDTEFLRDEIAAACAQAEMLDACAWAALCAEHVLHNFEDPRPTDTRPRKAIQTLRSWMLGKATPQEVRSAAFVCYTSAGETATKRASAAARACTSAARTPKRRSYALQAADYAARSVAHEGGDVKEERRWQLEQLKRILGS